MARINLLPWREERRKEQQKQFAVLTAISVGIVGVLLLGVHLEYSNMIDNQNSRNKFLQKEIKKVNKQINAIRKLQQEKNRLLARMQVIQELQHNRPEIVHLFDELVRIIPDGVYLKSYVQKNRNITVTGRAQSNARISALMRNIAESKWFASPRLKVIKTTKKDRDATRDFTLTLRQKKQQKPKAKNNGKKNNKGKKKKAK